MTLSPSTKRSLRTAFHGLIALITSLPTLLPLVEAITKGAPQAGTLATFGAVLVGWAALVSKAINRLEDAGIIPAWLKGDTVLPSVEDAPSVEVDAAADPVAAPAAEGDAAP